MERRSIVSAHRASRNPERASGFVRIGTLLEDEGLSEGRVSAMGGARDSGTCGERIGRSGVSGQYASYRPQDGSYRGSRTGSLRLIDRTSNQFTIRSNE